MEGFYAAVNKFIDGMLFAKYELPELEHKRIMFEREQLRHNPFWPHQMTPELKEALLKWAKRELNE